MLTPHEFRHAIKNGTITNYETYLTFPNEKYRIIMAEEGVAIDELVSLGSSYLITLLVENNHAQEYWHDWAIHEASTVKEAFDDLVNPKTYHEALLKIIQLRMRLDAEN